MSGSCVIYKQFTPNETIGSLCDQYERERLVHGSVVARAIEEELGRYARKFGPIRWKQHVYGWSYGDDSLYRRGAKR